MCNIYKKGENRKQQMFFPPSIDEYVGNDNQVRAIEDYETTVQQTHHHFLL